MRAHDSMHELLTKLQSLPPEQIREVRHFIEFLNSRTPDDALASDALRISAPTLSRIWNNDDDSAYDDL